MLLNSEQIESISCGTVKVFKSDKYTRLYRFTNEQIAMFLEYNDGEFSEKTHSSAGARLAFTTDSKTLKLKGNISLAGARYYYAIDLAVNGEHVDSIANFVGSENNDYFWKKFPIGEFEKVFQLGDGEKQVEVYLPFSVRTDIEEISIDDGAFIKPLKAKHKGLLFGDSITQGYDGLHPINHFAVKLSKLLDVDFVNKAIAGEVFNPRLAKLKDDIEPDYVVVVYGTNDWSRTPSFEEFKDNCTGFYQNIRSNYPKAKIFALSPIWRANLNDEKAFEFKKVHQTIQEVVATLGNAVYIDGFNLVPHQEELFADSYLHPNDSGFKYYAENLCKQIKDKL